MPYVERMGDKLRDIFGSTALFSDPRQQFCAVDAGDSRQHQNGACGEVNVDALMQQQNTEEYSEKRRHERQYRQTCGQIAPQKLEPCKVAGECHDGA